MVWGIFLLDPVSIAYINIHSCRSPWSHSFCTLTSNVLPQLNCIKILDLSGAEEVVAVLAISEVVIREIGAGMRCQSYYGYLFALGAKPPSGRENRRTH